MKKDRYTTTILCGRVVLLKNNKAILSPIYQGKAFPLANGNELISQLSQVYSKGHYQKYIRDFSIREYGFNKNENIFSVRSKEDFTKEEVVDFTSIDYEKNFLADWLYIKNLELKPIRMIFKDGHRISLEFMETIAVCQGNLLTYPYNNIIKTKDTIHSIVLTEKVK